MVYYFTSNVTDPPTNIYVGKDKFENENLIKYGLEEDVWYALDLGTFVTHDLLTLDLGYVPFRHSSTHAAGLTVLQFHVDNLSSAHIYVRMAPGSEWDKLPAALLEDCAQLTKANSIEGNKKDNVTVIYTPWGNLRKDGSMAVGQVAFHSEKKVRRVHVAARVNAVVNRLNKTRVERQPDLAREKEEALAAVRKTQQAARRARDKEDQRVARERRDKAWQRDHAYDALHTDETVAASSNQDRPDGWEDDFM